MEKNTDNVEKNCCRVMIERRRKDGSILDSPRIVVSLVLLKLPPIYLHQFAGRSANHGMTSSLRLRSQDSYSFPGIKAVY